MEDNKPFKSFVVGAVKTMKAVAEAGGLKIDVVSYPDVLVARDLIKREVSATYKNRFRVAGAKLTIDGSPQGFTAWRDRPYSRPVGNYPPGYSGYPAATAGQVGDAIDWAFANLDWDDVIHCIDPANAPSQALAHRLGSRNLGAVKLPAPYEDAPSEAWGQTRAEWQAKRERSA